MLRDQLFLNNLSMLHKRQNKKMTTFCSLLLIVSQNEMSGGSSYTGVADDWLRQIGEWQLRSMRP
jgi:hypothetical protein